MSFFAFQDIISCVTGIVILITLLLCVELIARAGNPETADQQTAHTRLQSQQLERQRDRLKQEYEELELTRQQLDGQPVTPERVRQLAVEVESMERDARLRVQEQNLARMEDAQLSRQVRDARRRNEELLRQLNAVSRELAVEESKPTLPMPGGDDSNRKPIFLELAPTAITVAELTPDSTVRQIARFAGADAVVSTLRWAQDRNAETDYLVLLVRPDAIELFSPLRRELRERGFRVGWDAWPREKSLIPTDAQRGGR